MGRGEQPGVRRSPRTGRLDRRHVARPRAGALVRPRRLPPRLRRRRPGRFLLDEGAPAPAPARARRPRRDLRDRGRPQPTRQGPGPCPHRRWSAVAGRPRHHRRHAVRRRRERGRRRALPLAGIHHVAHRLRLRARGRVRARATAPAGPSSRRSSPSGVNRATAPARSGMRCTGSTYRSTTPPRCRARCASAWPTGCRSRSIRSPT